MLLSVWLQLHKFSKMDISSALLPPEKKNIQYSKKNNRCLSFISKTRYTYTCKYAYLIIYILIPRMLKEHLVAT